MNNPFKCPYAKPEGYMSEWSESEWNRNMLRKEWIGARIYFGMLFVFGLIALWSRIEICH